MIELFPNITEEQRESAKMIFDLAVRQPTAYQAISTLINYRNLLTSDEEKDFVDFYFKLRFNGDQNNENNNDKR